MKTAPAIPNLSTSRYPNAMPAFLAIFLLSLASFCLAASGDAKAPYQPGGMWMPHQIAEIHADTLKKMGLEIDPQVFADPLQFPLNAIVSLGGCSASFVSEDGLVVTNHHCVRRGLQFNATEKNDLVTNGFLARTRDQELFTGPGSRIYVTTAVTDVTERMMKGIADLPSDLERYKTLQTREKALLKEAEAATPHTRCQVARFYGGGKYYLLTRLEIKDVRLVYAPHMGVGYFGGDIDNWMWPRHCGDFSFLRAYVGKDGNPADYSKDNVPFKPKAYLHLATEGPKVGDLSFVVGYPGRTQRLSTALETASRIEWEYPNRIELAQKHIDTLHALSDHDKELSLKAIGTIFGLENGKKKRQGILKGAERLDMVRLKREEEQNLLKWIGATPERQKKYGDAIKRINVLVADSQKTREKDMALSNISRSSSMLSAAITIVRMAEERPKADIERESGFQERDWLSLEQSQSRAQRTLSKIIDQGVMELYFREALALPAKQRPEIVIDLFGKGKMGGKKITRVVKRLLDGTKLDDLDTRLELLKNASTEDLKKSKDSMIQLALKIRPSLKEREDKAKRLSGAMILVRPLYYEALNKMKEGRLAPDANGTIRVSFGTVRGFRPAPGRPEYFPFTNVWQMVEKWAKNKGEYPFDAPPEIIEAVNAKRFGPYEIESLGGVPVDFLTDLDITGGNSGSATLNAKGELTGLAFDGNIEGVGSDLIFLEDATRAIHVDVRYITWVLDAVAHADNLLKELKVKPAFSKGK